MRCNNNNSAFEDFFSNKKDNHMGVIINVNSPIVAGVLDFLANKTFLGRIISKVDNTPPSPTA